MTSKFQIGQRLSFGGSLCTVRYVGPVDGTIGDWLGVEWDDPTRGKHSGEHNGKRYFLCKSNRLTAGSFVRPSRPADAPLSFLDALHEKYASEFEAQLARKAQVAGGSSPNTEAIEISGKVVEEVGFEKVRQQLAQLQELKIVLLDGLRVAGVLAEPQAESNLHQRNEELQRISRTCPKIVELDLSRNLIHKWEDVRDICEQLKRLQSLKLNGNRFDDVDLEIPFPRISQLYLDQTLLSWEEIALLSHRFTNISLLTASLNQISFVSVPLSKNIRSLALEHNEFTTLSAVQLLSQLPNIETLSLRGNCIKSALSPEGSIFHFSPTLAFLDLSHNLIDSWKVVNALQDICPGLSSLRISNNPLYEQAVLPASVTNLPEKPMTVDEAFMLTLARLRSLMVLNYSKITQQDRTNGELYYLSLIGKELSACSPSEEKDILANHPRYAELCETYGEPSMNRKTESAHGVTVNPRSVAARLVRFKFYLAMSSPTKVKNDTPTQLETKEETYEIPQSFDIYRIKAIVARLFHLAPLTFRLIWETDEWDPIEEFNVAGEEWDSEDDEDERHNPNQVRDNESCPLTISGPTMIRDDGTQFVKREVELVDSNRQVGYWIDDTVKEARVRIEKR